MRPAFLWSAAALGGLWMIGCTGERSPLPTQPPSHELTVSLECSAERINSDMSALFPTGDGLADARQLFRKIQKQQSSGDVTGAKNTTFQLIDFTLKKYYKGKLLDPNGFNSPTTQDAVVTLINRLLCFVGLPASGLTLGPTGAPVTTAVIGSSGGALKASDGLSALKVDPGTVSEDHLWVITRRDDLAQVGTCVTTKLQQIPLCIDFSVVPAELLAKPLLVVLCQPEDNHPADRRLAHQLPNNQIELLALQGDPFPLVCTSTPDLPPPSLGSIGRQVWRFGSLVARLLGPKPLYAGHSGLGGLLGPGLSDVTAVRAKLEFRQQPTNTAPGATITPAVTVAFKNVGTGEVATDVTNRIQVAIGTNPAEGTLSGTTTQTPTSGISTFADLSINNAGTGYTLVADAISSAFTDGVPLGIPDTSNVFDIGTLPDLTIGQLAEAPPNPTTGDVITLSGVVSNLGGVSAGATTGTLCATHFTEFGFSGVCGPLAVPSLSAGGSVPVTVTVGPLQAGTYTIAANVDSFPNDVIELNEDNHATGPTFTVSPALILDQSNDPPTSTTYYCENVGQSIYQSFTPGLSPLARVELRLQAGASFPAGGTSTTVTIRSAGPEGGPDGTVLGTTTAFVPGPQTAGAQILVPFDFSPAIQVTIGVATYFIQWPSPAPGGSILGWMGTNAANPYPNGSFFGCAGFASLIDDLNFKTYAPMPSRPN